MMMWSVLFLVRRLVGKPQVDLHHVVLWMHKVEAERMREEVILEIMGNQEENQRERGLNLEELWEIGAQIEILPDSKDQWRRKIRWKQGDKCGNL